MIRFALLVTSLASASACAQDNYVDPWHWQLPAGQSPPHVPRDNPMSADKVELGRHLFYDTRLSFDGDFSCGSCHDQARAFADGKVLPEGTTGDIVPRNAMALTNVAYRATYTWANPVLTTLEDQTLVPLLGEFPIELGVSGHEQPVLDRLADDPFYAELFATAFPDDPAPFSLANIAAAIASFERTLLSYDSPYDRWVAGDATAMSPSAQRGHDLFFSERAECYHCHGGHDFSNSHQSAALPNGVRAFHNTGLYNLDESGAYPAPNVGLFEFTDDPRDMGRFRVPTLRNVAVTEPFMHDGSAATLDDVLDHYERGGRVISAGPHAGDGALNPHLDPLVRPLSLTPVDREDLIAFLHSLTDETFLTNPNFANPWESQVR